MAQHGVTWTPNKLIAEVQAIVTEEMHREGKIGVKEIRASFSRGVSTPGNPPGVQSGTLYRGIKYQVIRGTNRLLFGATTNVRYAMALEFGDPSKGLRARPYLRPQRMRTKVRLQARLKKRLA